MSSRSKASRAGDELVWCVLSADEEHCPAYGFDGEAERFVVVLEESQQAPDRACASEQVDIACVES
jgi:hypothetical protein